MNEGMNNFGHQSLGRKDLRSVICQGLCGGWQIGIINSFPKSAQRCFSPVSDSFWVRVSVRVRVIGL